MKPMIIVLALVPATAAPRPQAPMLIDAGFPSTGAFSSRPADPTKARDPQRILAVAKAARVTRINDLLSEATAHWITLSASEDGAFAVTNSRTRHTARDLARSRTIHIPLAPAGAGFVR